MRLIALFSALFIVWFVYSERDGLGRFIGYLVDAIAFIPKSVQHIITYYTELPLAYWLPSILVGAALGIVFTVGFNIVLNGQLKQVRIPVWSVLAAGLLLLLLLLFEVNALLAILVAVLSFIAVLVLQPDFQQSIRTMQLAEFASDRASLVLASLGGALGGVVGSQVLMFPLRHCTYAEDASRFETQVGFLLTMIGAGIVLLPIWTVMGQRQRRLDLSTAGYFRGLLIPMLFLLPTVLILVVFLYFPASEILTTSLVQSNARIPGREVFVCLQNYVRLAEDVTYRNSFAVTATITIAIVVVALALSLGIAVLASQKVRGAYIYRTLLIWPYALSPVVAGVIFFTMFQPDSGLINYALGELFNVQPQWFSQAVLAQIMIIIASVWNILGFNILFYIAGLQTIPRDLLEAAEIDGAGPLARFWRITFPLLSPFTFFLLITNITYSFYGIYGVVDTLTQGGPRFGPGGASGATEVLIYRLYEGSAQAGFAAAQAVILFILIATMTILQFGYIERRVTYAE